MRRFFIVAAAVRLRRRSHWAQPMREVDGEYQPAK